MELLVRPFRTLLERPSPQPGLVVEGRIVESWFRFTVSGAVYDIPTVRTGVDELGEFAVLEETDTQLESGFRLSVAVDPPLDADEKPGCTIHLYKPHPAQEPLEAENPGRVFVLPLMSSLSVDFNWVGRFDGGGVLSRTSYDPRTPPPTSKH